MLCPLQKKVKSEAKTNNKQKHFNLPKEKKVSKIWKFITNIK